MRVFLGTNNIANILSGLTTGFQRLGCEVNALIKEKSPYYKDENFNSVYRLNEKRYNNLGFLTRAKDKFDYSRQRKKLNELLYKSIPNTDVYIFLWSTFRNDLSDLKILKDQGKKIIFLFAGSEVRYSNAFANEYNCDTSSWEAGLKNDDLNEKLYFLRNAELYSDLIYSVPDQSGLMIAPYNHFFMPIDMERYHLHDQNLIPKVLHAPTRTGIKGTDFILSVLKKIKDENIEFDFEFIKNLTHEQLISKLSYSDVLVDELFFHGPGMMGTEALACGCIEVTKVLQDAKFIFNPPVVEMTFDTAYSVIKNIILSFETRQKLALNARTYAENHNNCVRIAKNMIDGLSLVKRDYVPTFLFDVFKLENNFKISDENKALTKKVLEKYYPNNLDYESVLANKNFI